jgi:hypothetical protein
MLIQLMVRMMKLIQNGSMMSSIRNGRNLRAGAVEKIGRNIAHHQAEKHAVSTATRRVRNEDGRVKQIFEKFGVVSELKRRNIRPGGRPQPEAVDHDEETGTTSKKKDGGQGRAKAIGFRKEKIPERRRAWRTGWNGSGGARWCTMEKRIGGSTS